jgi:hypothetical protein
MSSGRLLIVAGATAASADELPESVRELIAQALQILVVAPVPIGLRAGAQADWQERSLVPRVKQAFGLPVTAIAIDDDGGVTQMQDN